MSDTSTPHHTWVPFVAAVGGTAFFVKGALGAWRGADTPDTAMGILYLGGIALCVTALIGMGLRQPSLARRLALGIGLPGLFLAWVTGLGEALEPVVRVFSDVRHVQEEVPIAVAGLAVLIVAWFTWSHDVRSTTSASSSAGASTSV